MVRYLPIACLALLAGPCCAAAQGLAAAQPVVAAPAPLRVALVPLENLASVGAARPVFAAALAAGLARRGALVVQGEPVEAYLEGRRIRWLDSFLPETLDGLLDATGADAAMTGTILAYGAGDGNDGVAVALRLLGRGGELLWSGVRAITALDTVGLLGLGRVDAVDALAARLVEGLLDGLPAGGRHGHAAPSRHGAAGPVFAWHDPAMPAGPLEIVLLPALNLTEAPQAARILDAALQQQLLERPGVRVVPPAALRRALVKLGLRAPLQLAPEQLAALALELGTPSLLKPTLLAYGAGLTDAGEPTLEVELHLLLVDTARDRVAWSAQARRLGTNYRGPFGRGAVHDTTSLASRLAGELVEALRP